jgi:hypothetical protein
MKNALKKIDVLDVKNKLGIDNFDEDSLQDSEATAKIQN